MPPPMKQPNTSPKSYDNDPGPTGPPGTMQDTGTRDLNPMTPEAVAGSDGMMTIQIPSQGVDMVQLAAIFDTMNQQIQQMAKASMPAPAPEAGATMGNDDVAAMQDELNKMKR